jgi:hypothetical protein
VDPSWGRTETNKRARSDWLEKAGGDITPTSGTNQQEASPTSGTNQQEASTTWPAKGAWHI